MVLSDTEVEAIHLKEFGYVATGLGQFARAIEAEVRKSDDARIRNFVAAIKLDRHEWEDWPEDSRKAFEALRARLEGKPCA